MKTLHLVLKHKWYDMIASGEKKEEYREIKPYWTKRLTYPCRYTYVCFHRGYTSTTMTFAIKSIGTGQGNPEWGAPNDPVFIIKLGKRV